jgi:tetratricopeptide (TPR) repeat protein
VAAARALVTACLHGGAVAEARRVIATFTNDHPMCAEGWRLAAQLEWKLGQYDQAMQVLARGRERLPNSRALHRQTALFWQARQNAEAAAPHLQRGAAEPVSAARDADWLDRVAQDAGLLDGLLKAPATEQGDTDRTMWQALAARIEALLESQPDHADRHLALARVRLRLDDLAAAMRSVARALRANPDYVNAQRLRATILGRMGKHDAAIEIVKSLIARGHDWADLHYQLAQLQRERGRDAEARMHLYSAIRVNPQFAEAKDLLERWAA